MELNNQNIDHCFIIITKVGQISTFTSNNNIHEIQHMGEPIKLRGSNQLNDPVSFFLKKIYLFI